LLLTRDKTQLAKNFHEVPHQTSGISSVKKGKKDMRKLLLLTTSFLMLAGSARAQVPLSAYTDAEGFIDVQTMMCSQLAGTFQEDADMLTTWYSGWYNGHVLQSQSRRKDHRCDRHAFEGGEAFGRI
jgi:hypothetical protein